MNTFKKALPYLAIFIISFFAFKPFLTPGFFPIHDDTQVARVFEMTKSLKDGMFPVRWAQDLGYGFGYPIFNFYDPLSYYIGGFLGLLGADALSATKIMVILAIIFSSFSMYLLAKEFWGEGGGILAAAFYVLAPYHAADLYVRGDFAEAWAYAFVPLAFYGIWKIYKEQKWKYVAIAALSFALTIISHNLTALMVLPFLCILIAFLLFQKRKTIYLPIALILGVLISAFYWFPAIFEMNYTNILSQVGGGADFRDHFVCVGQLWASPWGYGGSAKGCIDGISFMIGKYHIIVSSVLFVLSLIFLLSKKYQQNKEKLSIIILFYAGFLISGLLTLDFSKPVWEIVGPMTFFQYPWRFLIMIVFFSSFISGAFIYFLQKFVSKRWSYALAALLLIFVVLSNLKFFNPQTILSKNSSDYTNSYSLKWVASKTSDEYMPQDFKKPESYSEIASFSILNSKNLKLINFSQKTQESKFDLGVNKNMFQVFPIAYFPSWQGYMDDRKINIYKDKMGIRVNLPQGNHNFKLIFEQTPVENFGNWVSVAAILTLFGYNALKKKYE